MSERIVIMGTDTLSVRQCSRAGAGVPVPWFCDRPGGVPVLGDADDAIVAVVLRSITRRAGLERHWPGTSARVTTPFPGGVDTGDRCPRPRPKPARLISARGSRLPGRLGLRVRLSLLHTGGVVGVLRVLPELARRLYRLLTSPSTHGLLGIDVAPDSSGATNGRG